MKRLHVLAGVAVLLTAILLVQVLWRPFELWGRGSAMPADPSTDASSSAPAKGAPPAPHPLPPGLVRAIEDLRAAGFATTAAEWSGARLHDAENGALEVDAAAATLDTDERFAAWRTLEPRLFVRWWEDARPEQVAELRASLDASADVLALVEAGLRKPRMRWPMVESGSDVMPGSRSVRRIQDLCAAAARVRDGDGLLRVLAIQLRLDRRVEDGWVHRSGVEEATAALRDAVIGGRVKAADARRALDDDIAPFVCAQVPGAIRGGIVRSVRFFETAYGPGLPKVAVPRDLPPELESVLKAAADAAEKPIPSIAWGTAEDPLRAVGAQAVIDTAHPLDALAQLDAVESGATAVAKVEAKVWPFQMRRCLVADATLCLARVALAAKAYRDATGAWPVSLVELSGALGGAVPLDPMTEKPFVYEVGANRVRIAASRRIPGDEKDVPTEAALEWEFPR